MLSRLQSVRKYTVSAVDTPGKLSTLVVRVHAGSRYSPKDGVSHLLNRFNFQTTNAKSSLRLVRESEILGGTVESVVCREFITLRATFLKEQLPYFVETMGNVLYKTSFKPHELVESVLPAANYDLAKTDPIWNANDLLFQITYHNDGLARPILYDGVETVTLEDIKKFANKVYTSNNIDIVGTGVNETDLKKFVSNSLINSLPAGQSLKPTTKPAASVETETRLRSHGDSVAAIGVPIVDKSTIPMYQVLATYLNSALFPFNVKAQVGLFDNSYGLFKLFVQNEDSTLVTKEIKEIVSKLKNGIDISGGIGLTKLESPGLENVDKVKNFKLDKFNFVALGDVSNLPFKADL
ncbi:cytochrome b-c1 complex subunit 2, mitochondrial [Monosporozyma servazzii]